MKVNKKAGAPPKNKSASNAAKIKEEKEQLIAQVEELKDKNLRLFAEFDNFQKRTAKERIELYKTAGEEVITSLLPVIDDFERGLQQMESSNEVQTCIEGIKLIHNKMRTTLESAGLKEMKSLGEKFNAEIHDAISETPASSKKMKGKIIDEVEKGYFLNEKIIRHPKVVVGK